MKFKTYITGDIHGEIYRLKKFSEECPYIWNHTVTLIILGDCGFNYYKGKKDNIFKREVSLLPINIFAIRGNHEFRPTQLKNIHYEIYFGNRVIVEDDFPNIKYAIDGLDYYIPSHKKQGEFQLIHSFVMGGAYSPDAPFRKQNNWIWFQDEQMSKKELASAREYLEWLYQNNEPIEVFLTHTCPFSFVPTQLFIPMVDQNTVDNTMELFFDQIEKQYNYKKWYWGHFHKNLHYDTDNDKQQIMLFDDIEEF